MFLVLWDKNEEMSPIHLCNQRDFVCASEVGLKMLTNLLAKARIKIKKCNAAPALPVVNSVDREKRF